MLFFGVRSTTIGCCRCYDQNLSVAVNYALPTLRHVSPFTLGVLGIHCKAKQENNLNDSCTVLRYEIMQCLLRTAVNLAASCRGIYVFAVLSV